MKNIWPCVCAIGFFICLYGVIASLFIPYGVWVAAFNTIGVFAWGWNGWEAWKR